MTSSVDVEVLRRCTHEATHHLHDKPVMVVILVDEPSDVTIFEPSFGQVWVDITFKTTRVVVLAGTIAFNASHTRGNRAKIDNHAVSKLATDVLL